MSAVEWLERGYDKPRAFREPAFKEIHAPSGPFQIKPDHPSDCLCETGEGEFWLQAPTVMKWQAS